MGDRMGERKARRKGKETQDLREVKSPSCPVPRGMLKLGKSLKVMGHDAA